MKVYKHNTIIATKEIARKLREVASNVSDRLIHTAPRSVSLVHYTFRNDIPFVIPQNRTNSIRHIACEFVCAESPNKQNKP